MWANLATLFKSQLNLLAKASLSNTIEKIVVSSEKSLTDDEILYFSLTLRSCLIFPLTLVWKSFSHVKILSKALAIYENTARVSKLGLESNGKNMQCVISDDKHLCH